MKKILVYTHNSIGVGHAQRVYSLLKGMKEVDSTLNFLVLSGTSIPELFLREGIEVIKLPATKIVQTSGKEFLVPRYLKGISLQNIASLRQKIILETFEAYHPDIVIVEHNLIGQNGEMLPVLLEKWRNPSRFRLVFVTRGVIDSPARIQVDINRPTHKSKSIDIASLYDNVYVLEQKNIIDFRKDYNLKTIFAKRAKYLGPITIYNRKELAKKIEKQTKRQKQILVSLGRWGQISKIIQYVISSFRKLPSGEYQLRIQLDPYLDLKNLKRIKQLTQHSPEIIVSGFTPNLIEQVASSELVICRAGYNTIAELLVANTKAILFPEVGRTEEEIYRAKKVSKLGNYIVIDERKLNKNRFEKIFNKMLKKKKVKKIFDFSKTKIAKTILVDLKKPVAKE